jgi:hypothetical protein
MKIYISGQISGLEYADAFERFEQAERQIRDYCRYEMVNLNEMVNPMKLNHEHDKSWENYMLVDIKALFECDAIYMLKNWCNSKGARIERSIAIEMGIEIIYEK